MQRSGKHFGRSVARSGGWWIAIAGVLAIVATTAPRLVGQPITMADGARATIEVIQHLEYVPPSGWVPLTVRVNNLAADPRVWRISVNSESGVGTDLLGEWTLSVPGGETRDFILFAPQPRFRSSGYYAQILAVVSGPGVESGRLTLDRKYGGGNPTSFTGMSTTLWTENWSRLESEINSGGASSGGTAGDLQGARIDPVGSPADWRTWSGFATIWLHRDDWVAISGPQRSALLRWVAQGGRLFIAGPADGLTDLPPLTADDPTGVTGFITGAYGFGFVSRVPLESDPTSAGGPRLPIRDVANVVRNSPNGSPGLAYLSQDIPSTGAETDVGEIRPGGPMLGALIALIAILVGPVNLYLLAPPRRRARLFITVPLISLGGAIALVGLILFQDGTGGHGQRGVLVTLLPNRPEALVLQEQCVMTGLLVNRTFAVPEEMTLIDYSSAVSSRPFYTDRRQPHFGLDRVDAQASGEWFTSRAVHAQHLRTFVPTRASVTLSKSSNGTFHVLSTCPGTLRDLVVIDGDGRSWWAAEVPPGQNVELAPASADAASQWRQSLLHFGASLGAAAASESRPLSFHAAADSWDESVPMPTLPSIHWQHDVIIVSGPVREAKP